MEPNYDFSVYRKQGYSDDQIFGAMLEKEPLLKVYADQGYTPSQILGALEPKPALQPEPESGDTWRGVKTAAKQFPQLMYGAAAGVGAIGESMFGEGGLSTDLKTYGVRKYQEIGADIAKDAKLSDSLTYSWDQAYNQGNYGALVDWLQYGIGYGGVQALEALASAGIGAAVGKATLKSATQHLASGMVAKETAKIVAAENAAIAAGKLAAKSSADAVTKAAVINVATKIGQTAGVGVQAFGMEAGEIGGGLAEQSVKRGTPLTGAEIARGLGAVGAAGLLEFAGDKIGVDIMLGKTKLFSPASTMSGLKGKMVRSGLAATGAIPVEAGTEYLQTGWEEYGQGKEANILPFNQSKEAQRQALDAAGMGAVGGGGMAVVGGILSAPTVDDAINTFNASIAGEPPTEPPAGGGGGMSSADKYWQSRTDSQLRVQAGMNDGSQITDGALKELARRKQQMPDVQLRPTGLIDSVLAQPAGFSPSTSGTTAPPIQTPSAAAQELTQPLQAQQASPPSTQPIQEAQNGTIPVPLATGSVPAGSLATSGDNLQGSDANGLLGRNDNAPVGTGSNRGGSTPAPVAGVGQNQIVPTGINEAIKPIIRSLQNRNRNSKASILQMNAIAANPNPRLLMASPTMENGAPVVSDLAGAGIAKYVGNEDVIVTGKREIPFKYAVVEATQLSASNNADGSRNPDYAVDTNKLAAVTNGRVAGVTEAYRNGTARDYKKAIVDAAETYGFKEGEIRSMKTPVLVRLIDANHITADIGDESNTTGTLGLSAVEQARNDVGRVDISALTFDDSGVPTIEAMRGFIQAMPESERQNLAPNGIPTKQAADRILGATLYQAYGSPDLVELAVQSTEAEARTVISAMSNAAPAMMQLEGAGDLDIRPLIVEAVTAVVNAGRLGTSVAKLAKQGDLAQSNGVKIVLDMFAQNIRSARAIAERLNNAAVYASGEAKHIAGGDMFGGAAATKQDVLRRISNDTTGTENLGQQDGAAIAGQNAGKPAEDQNGRVIGAATQENQREGQRENQLGAALRPISQALIKFKGAGKTATNSKVIYDAIDRISAIAKGTPPTAGQRLWFAAKSKVLTKNKDAEAAGLFSQVAEHIKQAIKPVEQPAEKPAERRAALERDALYDLAVEKVTQAGRANISLIQRSISQLEGEKGYASAARLIAQMEASGVIGRQQGNGSHEILKPALTLKGQTQADITAQEQAQADHEAAQKSEEVAARAEQAARDQAAVDAKIKARVENPENFQFGESSKQAKAPVGDLFNQPASQLSAPDLLRAAAAKMEEAAKPLRMDGTHRPERAGTKPTPEFESLHPKSQEKFNAAWDTKDVSAMQEYLDTTNKGLRAEFENRSGIKLPKTISGTDQAVADYFAQETKHVEAQPEPKTPPPAISEKAGNLKQARFEDQDQSFHYSTGNMGMTSSGAFTADKSRWITFTREEALGMDARNVKPAYATKRGIFVGIESGEKLRQPPKPVTPRSEYQIQHKPMSQEGGAARLNDLTTAFGEDVYGENALQFYGSGDKREAKILKLLQSLRGKPDVKVTIYRGVPKTASGINSGDWITLDKSVAQDYVDQALENEGVSGKVISMEVPASHITSWPDALLEFGYFPLKETDKGTALYSISSDLDHQVHLLQDKYDVSRDEAVQRYYAGDRIDERGEKYHAMYSKGKQGANQTDQQPNEANREYTDKLEAAARKGGHNFTFTPVRAPKEMPVNSADAGTPRTSARLAERIAGIFGKGVIWIKARGDFTIDGVVEPISIPNKIFISVDTPIASHVVLGHELSHHLENDFPETYKRLTSTLEKLIKNRPDFRVKYSLQDASETELTSEMVGNIMGDSFSHPEFWKDVAKANPLAARGIGNKVMAWLNKLSAKIAGVKGYGSDEIVTDINAARRAVAEAVAEYAMNRAGTRESDANELYREAYKPQFSPLHSEGEKPVEGMSVSRVHQAILKLRSRWLGFRKIIIVQSVKDLPAGVGGLQSVSANPLRYWMTNVRGGWTKEKIRKELKQPLSRTSGMLVHREVAKFDNAQDLSDHIFYHGTSNHVSKGLKPSITMSERDAEQSGGGGYGERYWSISLSKSKEVASNFTGQSSFGTVYPVILKKGANVISRPDIQDAAELDDIIVELWEQGVDAVRIGDWTSEHSEQELAVLNPNAVFKYNASESYAVFNKKKFAPLTDDQTEKIYQDSVDAIPHLDAIKALPKEQREAAIRGIPDLKFSTANAKTEAIYDPRTNSVYLIADNIATPERAVWVAVHETSHAGLRMIDRTVAESLDKLAKNSSVSKLATAIAQDRAWMYGKEGMPQSEATEEAFAELSSAIETDNLDALLTRYGVKMHPAFRSGLVGAVNRVIEAIRNFIAKVMGRPVTEVTDAEVRGLIAEARGAIEGKATASQFEHGGAAMASTSTKQTDTAAFRAWFGQSVVTEDGKAGGKPLVVYHGTKADITKFDSQRNGVGSTIFGSYDVERHGIFITPVKELAEEFAQQGERNIREGANVMMLYASIKNPLDMTEGYTSKLFDQIEEWGNKNDLDGYGLANSFREYWGDWALFDKDNANDPKVMIDALKGLGFDGVKYYEPKTDKDGASGDTFVAFEPAQIKSAIGNRGTFDPTNPNILFSTAPAQPSTKPKTAADLLRAPNKRGMEADTGLRQAQSDISKLNKQLAKEHGKEWSNSYETADSGSIAKAASVFKDVFGTEVVAVKPTGDQFNIFGGMYHNGKIYVNVENGQIGFIQLAGHELLHDIKRKSPNLYKYLADSTRDAIAKGGIAKYGDFLRRVGVTESDLNTEGFIEEEMLGDAMGDALADPLFLKTLAEVNPSKFKLLMQAIKTWLKNVSDKLTRKGFGSTEYYSDVEKLRTYLAAVLVRYSQTRNPDSISEVGSIKYSRASNIIGDTGRERTPEQLAAFKNVGRSVTTPTVKERMQSLWKDAGKKLAQGLADQFRPIRDLSTEAYALMRLSKGASGAFEVLLKGGQLKLNEGVYDFDEANKGGAVDRLLIPLQGEADDFLWWVAANRAEKLSTEDREHLFTPDDIEAMKTLADGETGFDFTLQNGQTTRNRAEIYADSLKTFNEFNKNTLDMAEQSGLIDGESRKLWESEFYVPFYRVEEDGVRGMNIKSGVVRQQAFKQLKGGTQKLNSDLLDNTLMNWAHLLDAAAKNRAAKASLEAAERVGVATEVAEPTKKSVWFMDEGQKRHFVVDDPYVLDALVALEYAGMKNPVMNAMGTMKHALTVGVTASPFFKVRNLIRDAVQSIGVSGLDLNMAANVKEGWKLTNPKSDEYFRLLAGGGMIHFGTMFEGSESRRVRSLVEAGVDESTILDSESKYKAFYTRVIEPAITAYNELGNRGEAVNRASLYDQLIKQGKGHAEASLMARDLLDFSMQGAWTSVRFLNQTVPFFNARLQGLYKLGRATREDPRRMGIVLGATAMASIALMLAYSDDDDWKKREDWDRDNYWWFKIGGEAFRIPKPFEIGAIASLAERGVELFASDEMTGERFKERFWSLLGQNLSMNPVPQLVKPILDVYANKDSFTGRPIETMGMERLEPEYRYTQRTSMAARAAGELGASPVQVDHLIRGYFGWLGTFVVGSADVIAKPLTGQIPGAEPDYMKKLTGGMVAGLEDAPSRYVSQMYEQAKEIEQAHGTWRYLLKTNPEAAAEYRTENLESLNKYKTVEQVKRAETALNFRIRMIERSSKTPEEKRVLIRNINARKDMIARRVNVLNQ